MDLDEILKIITAGLSGDSEKDVAYLQEKCEEYKNHKYSQEIIRACGRLIFELLSDDKKEELTKIIDDDLKGTQATLKEIRFNVFDGKLEKALKLSEALVSKIEETPMFQNDSASEYYTFNSIFEQVLYIYYNRPQRDIRNSTIPYGEIFYIHGNLLFEMKRIPEAREYLKKALRWNPTSCTIGFEYIETFKVEKDLDSFFDLTKKQLKYAYKPEDVARCFRNLGYYYIEIKEHSVAAACYLISMFYDGESTIAQSQMYYIEQTAPKDYKQPTATLLEQYEEQYGLPKGADEDVIGLSYAYSEQALKDGEQELCVYFLEIYCGLTDDENAVKLLEELKGKLLSTD